MDGMENKFWGLTPGEILTQTEVSLRNGDGVVCVDDGGGGRVDGGGGGHVDGVPVEMVVMMEVVMISLVRMVFEFVLHVFGWARVAT